MGAALAGLALFLVLFFKAHWLQPPHPIWPALGMLGLGAVFLPHNSGASVFFCYAATTASLLLPLGWALAAVTTSIAAFLAAALYAKFGSNALALNTLVIICTSAIYMQVRVSEAAHVRLYWREEEIAEFHKASERRRIAQDLHDQLGHSLSLIAVKAELAGKVTENEQARSEIRDIAAAARATLTEVRHVIGGRYRTALDDELIRAEALLRSAAIAPQAGLDLKTALAPAQDGFLALVLREAVTNIVRHSGAKTCRIMVQSDETRIALRVADDGHGARLYAGLGVTGMRERAERMGGTFAIDGGDGTVVEVVVPASGSAG